jgi:hypothetical protein
LTVGGGTTTTILEDPQFQYGMTTDLVAVFPQHEDEDYAQRAS